MIMNACVKNSTMIDENLCKNCKDINCRHAGVPTTKERLDMSAYQRHGFSNRTEYLRDLAIEYDVDESTVSLLADMLGSSEDFDGLVSALEDYAE